MRDEDKPFIFYRTGKWSFKIAPRNAAGVRATLCWVLALAPIVGLFIWALSTAPNDGIMKLYIVIYGAAMLAWSFAMFRWTKARSEIVDFDELIRLKRELDRAEKRTGG